MTEKRTYEEGLIAGRLEKLQETVSRHAERLDSHSRRLAMLEKACWLLLGIGIAFEVLPEMREAFKILSGG